jgi:nucleoid-associated protein YgaU
LGETVVAGRAAPNSQVVLTNKGEEIARAQADSKGEFVILPPALAPGDHVLTLNTAGVKGDSAQNVTVSVPQKGAGDTLVALTEPDKPTRVLTDTARPAPAAAGAATPAVAIRSVEADETGAFFASGIGAAGATIRLYLNEIMVATVQAGADRQWSLKIEKGMTPGGYRVRADMIDPANGSVQARAEAPFDYPERRVASAGGTPLPPPRPTGLPAAGASAPAAGSAPAARPEVSMTPAPGQPRPVGGTAGAAPPQIASPPASSGTSPAQTAAAPPGASGAPQANVVIGEIQTVLVLRGDNLWRISRKVLGSGMRYTQIYEANATQIRDPRLIYPKQIFVMPGAAN